MTYNPNHLSNANAQAAASMMSVGIGNVGGKAITSSAQAIQDNFMAEFRKDDDKPKGLGVPDTKKVKPEEDDRNLDQKIYDFLVGAGADMEVKEEEPMYMMDFYGGPMFVVPEPISVQQQVLEDPFGAYNVETYNFGGYNDTRDTAPSIGQTVDPDMQDPRRGLMASPTMNQPTTPEALTYVNRAMAKASAVPTKSYTVKDGDTLSQIAEDNDTTVESILNLNSQIDDKDIIDAGARIEIPLSDTQAALRRGLDREKNNEGVQTADSRDIITDTLDSLKGQIPERDTELDPMSAQEASFERKGIKGIMSSPTTLTAAQRTALSNMGSDVARTNLQNITNRQGNYSQTALTNAIDKGVRDQTKRALLKGASQTEVGTRGLVTEGTGYRLNRAYEMFEDATVNAALESLPPSEQTRIRNGAASNALGTAIMDMSYDGGSEYRGRGLVQLTHRENYQAVEDILESNGININLVDNPDLANDTRYALPIALAYLEHAGLDDEAASNSSTKDLNNRINPGANREIAEERWGNVVQALRDAGQDQEANRMANRNEYAAQDTVGTTVDGVIGPNSRAAMREWLSERDITIPENADDIDLVELINENS